MITYIKYNLVTNIKYRSVFNVNKLWPFRLKVAFVKFNLTTSSFTYFYGGFLLPRGILYSKGLDKKY